MKIEVQILKNGVLLETETFVESDELEGAFSCKYSVAMREKMIEINEQILGYEWYKNGVKMIGEENKNLFFDEIVQQLNGTYECRIVVKNKQTIRSQQFDLIVYKCKKYSLCNARNFIFICVSKSKNKKCAADKFRFN